MYVHSNNRKEKNTWLNTNKGKREEEKQEKNIEREEEEGVLSLSICFCTSSVCGLPRLVCFLLLFSSFSFYLSLLSRDFLCSEGGGEEEESLAWLVLFLFFFSLQSTLLKDIWLSFFTLLLTHVSRKKESQSYLLFSYLYLHEYIYIYVCCRHIELCVYLVIDTKKKKKKEKKKKKPSSRKVFVVFSLSLCKCRPHKFCTSHYGEIDTQL